MDWARTRPGWHMHGTRTCSGYWLLSYLLPIVCRRIATGKVFQIIQQNIVHSQQFSAILSAKFRTEVYTFKIQILLDSKSSEYCNIEFQKNTTGRPNKDTAYCLQKRFSAQFTSEHTCAITKKPGE